MMTSFLLAAIAVAIALGGRSVIRRRRKRYKGGEFRRFEQIRDSVRTGDIILFHKTRRTGFIDSLELDVISPLLFGRNEFRHCGIILQEGGEIFVLECADAKHSGFNVAKYVTRGNGLRLVEIRDLLREYTRDNGDPHFGVLHIAEPVPNERFRDVLASYDHVDYLATRRTALVLFADAILPSPWSRNLTARFSGQMMCSEFLHHFLHQCGVLAPYHSKTFVTYLIENKVVFRALQRIPYSEIVRFEFDDVPVPPAADRPAAASEAQLTAPGLSLRS
jgi:hypothetical protein